MLTASRSAGSARVSSSVERRYYAILKNMELTCRLSATSVMLRLTADLRAFDTSQLLTLLTGPCCVTRTALGMICPTLPVLSTEWLRRHLVAVILQLFRPQCEGFVMVWNLTFVLRATTPSARSSAHCVQSDSGRCRICADTCAHTLVQTSCSTAWSGILQWLYLYVMLHGQEAIVLFNDKRINSRWFFTGKLSVC